MKKIKRCICYVLITPIYWLGCVCYDKKYLTGRYFNRYHFSKGWKWILDYWFSQKVLGKNKHIPFPVPPYTMIAVPDNIIFHPDDMQIFHSAGSYFQGIGANIELGHPIFVAPGVGMITSNHDFDNLSVSQMGKDIRIGNRSWIGMNAVILPGVTLGEHTIVGAGAVVTKSFPEGNCVLAGNPAKVIKKLEL